MPDIEKGFKWYLRYVLVPLIGTGGVVAIIVAFIIRPPQTSKFHEPDQPRTTTLEEGIVQLDALISDNQFDEAWKVLIELQISFPSSHELYYRAITLPVWELKWAAKLPGGDERTRIMTKAIQWQDYLGLVCELSSAYINLFGQKAQHYVTVSKLHELSLAALDGAPCEHRPLSSFDGDEFKARLPRLSAFVKALESFSPE